MPSPLWLVDPPREVPLGLRLLILGSRDVSGSLLYLLPSGVALIYAAQSDEKIAKIGLTLLGTILLALALYTALPSLARSARAIYRMHHGFLAPGRIISCRLAWDRKGKQLPYDVFLPNWVQKVGESQMGKAYGCFTGCVVVVFLVPFVLGALAMLIVLVLGALGKARIDEEASGVMVAWISGALGMVAIALLLLRRDRRLMIAAVKPYMEWRRLAQPGKDDTYDGEAMRLVEEAKARGVQISLKEPLPETHHGVELICEVEYSIAGERRTGEGRVRLAKGLDPSGVEPLLFHPARPDRVVLLAGLPPQARPDASGRWPEVQATGPAIWLTLAGLVGVAALTAFGINLQALLLQLR